MERKRSKLSQVSVQVTGLLDDHFKTGSIENCLVAKDLWLEAGGDIYDWPKRYFARTTRHSLSNLERMGWVWEKEHAALVSNPPVRSTYDMLKKHLCDCDTTLNQVDASYLKERALIVGMILYNQVGAFEVSLWQLSSKVNWYYVHTNLVSPIANMTSTRNITRLFKTRPYHMSLFTCGGMLSSKNEQMREFYNLVTGDFVPIKRSSNAM